jgi:hypothetical protein
MVLQLNRKANANADLFPKRKEEEKEPKIPSEPAKLQTSVSTPSKKEAIPQEKSNGK